MSERYHLVLRAEPGNWRTPAVQRLRLALKALLRGFGLRAVEVKVIETEKPK